MSLRFNIGDYVRCKTYIVMAYNDKNVRHADAIIGEFEGWIVGRVRRQLGMYCHANGDSEDFEPAGLAVTGTLLLWKVAKSMENIPLEVIDQDIELISSAVHLNKIPAIQARTNATDYTLDAGFRDTMRDEMKNWPRDSKGHWLKKERK